MSGSRTRALTFLAGAAFFIYGCNSQPPAKPPAQPQPGQFSGTRAYEYVQQQVNFGPRPSGSGALERTAEYIKTQLQDDGLTVDEQVFTASTPYGLKQFRNVIAKSRVQTGGPGRVIIIGSHYDTKFMTNVTFVGANDAGSSTGVLLEIARVAANQRNLWFVFFDGEEAMVNYDDRDGLWGSKFFVESLKNKQELESVKAMVLLDMVGDADLNVTIPANGAGWLMQKVFEASRDVGFRDYFGLRAGEMTDDHVPFLNAGIPAIDLIDFEYGSAPGRNDYWHTANDTLDKVSAHSLEVVGQTTLRLVELLESETPGH
ncbi:MAG TPA: M28 family peptidase [Verrucomicrobiae bacterium]|nr:M28 family peptidase [Verrucomicrobiae bacterium]